MAKEASDQPPSTPRRPARTELVWEGKYDSAGNRRAPLRVTLPFQTIETVNESAADRKQTLDLFASGKTGEWRNRLVWGDKKYVLPSLLAEFAGKVNLIYIDPPFDTGADFSFTATVPDHPDTPEDDSFTFTKEPSIIEHKAYRDTWGRGMDSYLQWFYETAVLLHELLHENGSLYVHLDYHVAHYAKIVLDEVFGQDNLRAAISWKRVAFRHDSGHFGQVVDDLFVYSKGEKFFYEKQIVPYDESYIKSHYTSQDEGGRFTTHNLSAAGHGEPRKFGNKVIAPPPGAHWRFSQQNIDRLLKEGKIVFTSSGKPRYKMYAHEMPGKVVDCIWTDIAPVNSQAKEDTQYSTQKPEALLERIIKSSSNENDLVLDCFCGSGTTAAVAEKLQRRWITCDLGRFAIHTARKRLLSIPGVRPFIVQNLGKYERQQWQAQEFEGSARVPRAESGVAPDSSSTQTSSGKKSEERGFRRDAENSRRDARAPQNDNAARTRAYLEFILQLYHATPLNGYSWLHGVKGGRMVHVGSVDAPVSTGDVTQIAAEFKRAVGTGKDAPKTNGVDIVAWEFAFELNEVAKQQAAAANIQLRFMRIPHDAMDKRAVEQGDIHFFELAALSVDVKADKRAVTLKLKDFVIPPDDVPADVQKAVKHWSQWIDYWAVDWDNQGDTFHNEWQTYRTRKDGTLALETTHTYAEPGEYTVVVKVVDILGNDTTKTVKVRVK